MARAIIRMTDGGVMVFRLFPLAAPISAANFADLANAGFYDGLAFCRVVRDYVIQGGSPDNNIMTDSHFHIIGEFEENGYPTGLDHRRGAISMARNDAFDTAGTQFFIVHQDAHQLNGRYAAFGYMESGFRSLDSIASVPTQGKERWNKPLDLPVIQTIRVTARKSELPDVRRMRIARM